MEEVKQVIILRSDLKNKDGHKVRTGKMISQACHASMAAILNLMHGDKDKLTLDLSKSDSLKSWINGSFTKVCLVVNSETELLEVYQKAVSQKIPCSLITDAGKTEFNGVPTKTCCAIGPANSNQIDKITGDLKLY